MKIRNCFFSLFSFAFLTASAPAASFQVTNVLDGQTDRLYADPSGVPLPSGIAMLGYFPSGFSVSTNVDIYDLINNFNVLTSGAIGGLSESLGGGYAGYVEALELQSFTITLGNPLIGRPVYTFLGNGATLAQSTAFALYQSGTFSVDSPTPVAYTSLNYIGSPVIGTFGTSAPITYPFIGLPIQYPTLNFVAIPEPSAALLGVFGCTVLLRRRRR
jgi:hypothetical protein